MPETPDETTPAPVSQRPALMALATAVGVQATQSPGGPPLIVLQLSADPIIVMTFPLTLDQARQHCEDVGRCILEAEGIALPDKPEILRP